MKGVLKISWNNALELISKKFKSIIKTYGSEAIWYYYAGTMGLVQRMELII